MASYFDLVLHSYPPRAPIVLAVWLSLLKMNLVQIAAGAWLSLKRGRDQNTLSTAQPTLLMKYATDIMQAWLTWKTVTYMTHELNTKSDSNSSSGADWEHCWVSFDTEYSESVFVWHWASVWILHWIAHFLYCCALYKFFFWGFDFVSGNLATTGL